MSLGQIDFAPIAVFQKKAKEISTDVQDAFVEAIGAPLNDKFQFFRSHDEGGIVFDPTCNNVDRQSLMINHVLMVHMHPVDKKRGLYGNMVNRLVALGIRKKEILIAVTENGFEDWYAGRLYGDA